MKEYVRDFIFKQKCIPWRILKLYQCGGLRDIALDKLFIDATHKPTRQLERSVHVKFLQQFKDTKVINQEEFKKSAYFHHARTEIKNRGAFFGISDENEVIERAQYFLKLYRAIKNNSYIPPFRSIAKDIYPKDCYPQVKGIRRSSYYVIRDGHHRCACYYMLGKSTVKAEAIGWSRISLKDIVREELMRDERDRIFRRKPD